MSHPASDTALVERRPAPPFNAWDWIDRHFKLLALLPALAFLVLFTILPALQLVRMAFHQIDFINGVDVWTWAFERNLNQFLGDAVFRAALYNTVIFVFVATTLQLIIGFAFALVVSHLRRGKGLIRTAMLLPILIPPVAIGSMWRLMYNPDFGVIPAMLGWFGAGSIDLLGSTSTALLAIIIVDVWHWTPFVFLVLLAAHEALPEEVFEAASIDGAGFWQRVRYVIVPMMWPAIVVVFMYRSIVTFKVFDEIYLLTSGGPGTATQVISLYVYQVYFHQNQLGYGALLAIVTIAIICAYLGVFGGFERRRGGKW